MRSILLIVLAGLLLGCMPPVAVPAPARTHTYLPYVDNAARLSPLRTPTATARPKPTATLTPAPCATGPAAIVIALLRGDARQERPRLECDPRLMLAAQRRAAAQFGEGLSHCDRWGICANTYVRAAGCKLPAAYSLNGNNVESLAGGMREAVDAFASLARSPSHAEHLFGRGWFRRQDRVGVGLAILPLKWQFYWAIIIADCEPTSGE